MKVTIDWMYRNYKKYNDEIFEGKLPNIGFALSMSYQHSGYASYIKDEKRGTVRPVKILLSNYFNSTEEEAINTLLHEMIHIEDYTLNPEHFFDKNYDAHFSSFFQSEKKRINAIGFSITEYVTQEESKRAYDLETQRIEAEKKRIEAEKKSMENNGVYYVIGILKLDPKKEGDKTFYIAVWTEEKYMEKVYYGFINYAYDFRYTRIGDRVDWYKCYDSKILDFKECKGKITKNNELTFTYNPQAIIDNLKLQKFDSWSLINRKIFNNDKLFFVHNLEMILNDWKDKFLKSFNHNWSFIDSGGYLISNLSNNMTDFFNKRNKKDYTLWIGYDKYKFANNGEDFSLYLPYDNETLKLLYYLNNLRENGQLDETMLNNILNKCQELIRNQIMTILNGDNMMNESRINRIISESISNYIKNDIGNEETDDSIVSKKEISDGVYMITQW